MSDLKNNLPENSATAQVLMTRSLLASRRGRINEAITLCEKAVSKAVSEEAKTFPKQFLEYLKAIPQK